MQHPLTVSFRSGFQIGRRLLSDGIWTLSGFAIEFPLQRGDPSLAKAMAASTEGLKMLFRRDRDRLNRMGVATDLNRTLVTAPADQAVIELITEALYGALEEFVLGDSGSHVIECMGQSRDRTDLVIRRHE